MNKHTEKARTLPDEELTAILEQLRPKPGEQRLMMMRNGVLDLYMTPESARNFQAMLERIEALVADHGHEQALAIYDASMAATFKHQGTLQ